MLLTILVGRWALSGTSADGTQPSPRFSPNEIISVGLLPTCVALNRAGSRAYVTNEAWRRLSVVNTTASPPTTVATIVVGEGPFGLAVSPDDSFVYVANNGDDTVSVVDTATEVVIATRSLEGRPRDVAFTRDGSKAYVTARGGLIAAFDTTTHDIVDTFELGGQPFGIKLSPDGKRAYVAQREAGIVAVLDVTAPRPAVVATIPVGRYPQFMAISPEGENIYVTNLLSDSVSIVDTQAFSAVTIAVGDGPESCALSPDGKWLYVANQSSDSITVIDTSAKTVTATIRAPVPEPRGIAIADTPRSHSLGGFTIVGVGASSKMFTAMGR
jgi:YVTN family beta-propeller protein